MRLTLATKITGTILAVIGLALATILLAVLMARHVGRLFQDTVSRNIASLRAAEELEIALLLEHTALRSYLLDNGNPRWLAELQSAREDYQAWWLEVRETAHTDQEQEILQRLEEMHRRYAIERDRIVSLHRAGDVEKAREILLGELQELYRQTYDRSEEYLAANQQYVDAAVLRAQARVDRLTWVVLAGSMLTLGLGTALVWMLVRGILLPLRRLVADTRGFAGQQAALVDRSEDDDLQALGNCLRILMSNMAGAHSSLQENRRRLLDAEKKLASVGKLAASVAHEIRNPLGTIQLCLYSMQKTGGATAEGTRKLKIIADEIARLDAIVKSFLEFSRPPRLQIQVQDISEILDQTWQLARHAMEQKGISARREEAKDLPLVMADPAQLKQVLLNLLKNATEATPEGGDLCMSTSVLDAYGRSMVAVRVRNTGPGVPPEVRDHIFEPFFTTKQGGTGLGLAIAARIMAQHDGRLVLENTSPQGTTFALWLPVAEPADS